MITAVPPQHPTPSAMMLVHPSSNLWIRLQVSVGGECCLMPARKASTCTEVGRGKAQEAAQTTNPRAHPKKKARRAAPNSDPAQSRLPVVWRPLGESQPSQEPAAQPKAGLATAPNWGFALSAPSSEVLAVVPHGAHQGWPGPDATALQQQARPDSLEEAQLGAVLHVSRLEETQPTEGPHGSSQPTVSLPQPSTRPSATAGPGPDTPSQPMAVFSVLVAPSVGGGPPFRVGSRQTC